MALLKINGNQINTATNATISSLSFSNTNSILKLPSGTTLQRPTGAVGIIRYNSELDRAEVYTANGTSTGVPGWVPIGAETGIDGGQAFVRTNGTTITKSITIGPSANGDVKFTHGFVVGEVTINSNIDVTIESGSVFAILGVF
jgi:hypothetical protein